MAVNVRETSLEGLPAILMRWISSRSGVPRGIDAPAFSDSLAYYDGYRSARLPANLTQAQRLLNRAAPFAVRYNLPETVISAIQPYKDFLGREKTRQLRAVLDRS